VKITAIGWRGYALPFRQRYITSVSQANRRFGLLLFLLTSDGLVGIGEAAPAGTGNLGNARETVVILEKLAPRLLESDTDSIKEAISVWGMPAPLRFGLETALLDLEGQDKKLPMAVLLGSKPSSLTVNALIAAESPKTVAMNAREAVELGFTNLKLKVGNTLPKDEKLVSALRQAVGAQVKLRLDANQAWDISQAIESIRQLSRYQLEYVEQPVAAVNIAGLAKVRRSVPVAIAADESLGSLDDLHRLINAGAADVFIIKASRLGSFRAGLEVATEVLKTGLSVVVTTSLESGVGVAASAHLAAALPDQPYPHGLATGLLFEQDLTYPRLRPSNGKLLTPDTPGLGVKVDAMLLRKYSIAVMGSAGSSLSGLREYLSL
jgi:o-succinylbenzoate synthase